ncbi:ribosome biogenesis protein SLX9 homolog [Hydra vulgaris]|uniref:ribosome biogenesis protein SLX9 homolog n=1 Tax=Hydra vulgaris TaxID=6087 RepID=UPI0032EA5B63
MVKIKKAKLFSKNEKLKKSVKIPTQEKNHVGALSKKKKREIKKKDFLSKLVASHETKCKTKRAQIRAQTVIVGDLDPLLDALSDIKPTEKKAEIKIKPLTERKKKISSEKKRMQSDFNDITLFHQIFSQPTFKQDPLTVVNDHIKGLV